MRISLLLIMLSLPWSVSAKLYVTVIQGLAGNEHYSKQFDVQTKSITRAANELAGKDRVTVLSGKQASRENILAHFSKLQKSVTGGDRVALFLIGHGSFDGRQYKFNIPGPDLTDKDIGDILQACAARRQLLVDISSASGAVLKQLKNDSRIIITATRSGNERIAPRFGEYFVAALTDHSADTNKNDAISVEEAFTYAERLTQDYYKNEGHLATEHPQLEGQHADQFILARLATEQTKSTNPDVARLLKQRQDIDQQIDDLKTRKDDFNNRDDYYNKLQDLLLQASRLDEQIDKLNGSSSDDSTNDNP